MNLAFSILTRVRCLVLVGTCIAILAASTGLAQGQERGNGPTSIIISYRAQPALRAEFAAWLETDGVRQFDRWKADGVYHDYRILFSSYAASVSPDAIVVLDFDKFTDTERWQEVERRMPGGLSPKGLALGAAETSSFADAIAREEVPSREPRKAVYMIIEYDLLVDTPRYEKYVHGYILPQFREWIRNQILSGYTAYVNQNPAGAPWASMIILEYTNFAGLASREIVKNKVRAELGASNAEWKALSNDKTAIRKEKSTLIARPILP